MTKNERLVVGLLGGLLVVGVLVWCWQPLVAIIQSGFFFLFTIGLGLTYGWWLYAKRAVRAWLPPSILLGCLLLTACLDMRVYQRAHTVSYTREEGMLSETVYYTPNYEGEAEAIALVMGGPLLGVGLLWWYATRGQRGWQFLHYLVLLLTVYPLAAVVLFSSIGTKPRYYDGAHLPAIVTNSR
jgi:hypothetical protein